MFDCSGSLLQVCTTTGDAATGYKPFLSFSQPTLSPWLKETKPTTAETRRRTRNQEEAGSSQSSDEKVPTDEKYALEVGTDTKFQRFDDKKLYFEFQKFDREARMGAEYSSRPERLYRYRG